MKQRAILVLVVFLLVPSQAEADLVSYSFSGNLSYVSDTGNLLGDNFSIGDIFTGTLSYESDSPDGSPSLTYFTSPAEVSVTAQVEGYLFTSHTGSVDLNSDADLIYFITGFNSNPFIELGSNPGRLMTVLLYDSTGSVFQADSLPTSLDLNDFSSAGFQLFGDTGPGGPTFSLNGSITSLTSIPDPTVIPAPGAFLLASMGLGMVGWLSRKKNENEVSI